MAEREQRHHHRRHRKNKEHHRKKKSGSGDKKEEKEVPHVKLSSEVEEIAICGDGDTSGEETKITLTRSEERYRQYLRDSEDERYEKLAIEKGWCSNDGVPWGRNQMPKDEAALLKQGIIDRTGARLTHDTPPSETRVSLSPSSDLSESSKRKKKKKPRKSKSKEVSSSSQSQITATSPADGTFGTIRCDAGEGKDAGTITYTVTNDGRNYQLNTNDGHYLHLEFNKKHAYLIVD